MENQKILVSGTPHVYDKTTTGVIMLDVLLALAPAAIIGCVYFGLGAVTVVALAVASAVLFEFLYQKIMKKPVTIRDLSAAVTGLLLAMNLPASAPWWLPIVGSFFAIVLAKQLFGGLGFNFINPALAARAFLLASYPQFMTDWSVFPLKADAVSAATPLAVLKSGGYEAITSDMGNILKTFIGFNKSGCIGEVCGAALVLGGIYLLARKVINWRIPFFYIGTAALLTWVFGRGGGWFTGRPGYELLIGGLLLGAFFMATDYTTSPITPKGRIIMGVGCGVITVLIRLFSSGYPEGVSYSILLMNLAVPLIDKATRPRVFGEVRKHAGNS